MFEKEIEMQNLFICKLKNNIKNNEFISDEFDGRFGNVDVVKVISNSKKSLSYEQMDILRDYQCAKITGYLHKNQSHNIKYLMEKTNYTYDNIHSALNKLKKVNVIKNLDNGQYIIDKNFEFPNLEFISYELKLKNWKNAISQANKNKSFSSYSYIVLPMQLALKLSEKEKELFKLYNVGLIGINKTEYKNFYKPKIEKSNTRKNPTYISSLAKIIIKEKEQLT